MNYGKIKEYCDDRKISLTDLAKRIDLTRAGLYLAISKGTLSVKKLEEISSVLNVPIWHFFDLDPETPYIKEIEQQKNRNKISEETCEQMKKVIDDLKNRLSNIKFAGSVFYFANEANMIGNISDKDFQNLTTSLSTFLMSDHSEAAVEKFRDAIKIIEKAKIFEKKHPEN